ncbi:MAG: hypothetical protein J2P27_19575 [Actinobacteria bacterium]|nr:hypothetical protein [Actinomycetota bacterium]
MLTPVVDGSPLTELAAEFESRRGYSPAGGYAGLVPAHFRFGDLVQYFLGQENGQWPRRGYAWLLGCDCGEIGCWPLEARIITDPETVTWTDFVQPHRRARDYQSFGNFVFGRAAYERAVREAVEALGQ